MVVRIASKGPSLYVRLRPERERDWPACCCYQREARMSHRGPNSLHQAKGFLEHWITRSYLYSGSLCGTMPSYRRSVTGLSWHQWGEFGARAKLQSKSGADSEERSRWDGESLLEAGIIEIPLVIPLPALVLPHGSSSISGPIVVVR
jgi:hypothetical protein